VVIATQSGLDDEGSAHTGILLRKDLPSPLLIYESSHRMLLPEKPRPSAVGHVLVIAGKHTLPGKLTVERVSSSGVSLDDGILDVQVVGLDPGVPANGLSTLETVNFGIVDFPGN
jgi:hypothetical protein